MSTTVDDELWSAIGDPTRRRVIDLLLAARGGTASSLSEHLPVSRQAISKHLGVLDRAGLVETTRSGRERIYQIDPAQLARRWDAHRRLRRRGRGPRRSIRARPRGARPRP